MVEVLLVEGVDEGGVGVVLAVVVVVEGGVKIINFLKVLFLVFC